MLIGDNQTREDVLANVKPETLGIGVFAVPDPTQAEPRSVDKVVVRDITYLDCVQRGRSCIAFKWSPKSLERTVTQCPTRGALCAKSCAHDLCLCIDGACL
jgi:hypothetical protein